MKFGFVLRFRDPPRGENVRQMWLENLEMAKLCEDVGFDSCFTAEHHGIIDGYNPFPFDYLCLHSRSNHAAQGGDGRFFCFLFITRCMWPKTPR